MDFSNERLRADLLRSHAIDKDYIRLAEEKFEKMISEVEDYAIFLLDPNGTILSWNKGAEKIKGYKASEIIGKSYQLFYSAEDLQNNLPQTLLEQARKNGKVVHEGWRIKKDGYRFWGNITITAIHDANGNIAGFLKLTKDLTEKKISDDRYNNVLEELRLKNADLKREEERYHNMVSEIQDYAIILLDTDGKVLDWNKGAEKLKGYKAQEIIGKNFRLFYTQEDRDSNLPQRLLQEAKLIGYVSYEGFRVRNDGTRFWGSVALTALHDQDGNVTGYSKVTKDLTERKRADDQLAIYMHELKLKNEELRRSEERYQRMILEVQDYAILLLNSNGDIQNWNAGAEIIKGYKAEEIVGKSFKTFYTREDIQNGLPEKLLKAAEEYGRASNEGWRKRKDGTTFWASVVITALHDESGALIGFSKVTRDLTERKKYEDRILNNTVELAFKNQELENLNAELSSFAYIVSHDLKEPVRKMRIFADRQLEQGMSIEEIKTYSRKILASAAHMQALMEGILLFSKISNEHLDKEELDLNDTINSVIDDLEFPIQEHKAKIIKNDLPVITGIKYQLHQLFLNLLSNAIKFAKPDVPAEISITCRLATGNSLPKQLPAGDRAYYQITVTDNGIGFEQKHHEKIFDVFKRLKQKKEASGTGIGLSIVKKIAINHNGYVTAESRPNEGAQFHIFLPVDQL